MPRSISGFNVNQMATFPQAVTFALAAMTAGITLKPNPQEDTNFPGLFVFGWLPGGVPYPPPLGEDDDGSPMYYFHIRCATPDGNWFQVLNVGLCLRELKDAGPDTAAYWDRRKKEIAGLV